MTTATIRTRRARTEGARVQTIILFITSLLLALTVVGLATRAHASMSCATRSIATATDSCQGQAPAHGSARNAAPVANVTFVFER